MYKVENTISFFPRGTEYPNTIGISVGYDEEKKLVQTIICSSLELFVDDRFLRPEILFFKKGDAVFQASLEWVTSHQGILRINYPVDTQKTCEKLTLLASECFPSP